MSAADHSGYAATIHINAADHLGNAANMIMHAIDTYQVAAVHSGNAADMIKVAMDHSTTALFPKWNLDLMITVEAGNNTTMNVSCIRAGVKDLSSGDLLAKAGHVEKCLTGNPYFTAPVPSLAALHNASTQLLHAIGDADSGAHAAVAVRWVRHAELERILVQLSKYVMATAQGNVGQQVSSGFDLRRPPLRITELTAPAPLSLRRPRSPDGDMLLHWGAVHGARLYQVYMTTDYPTEEANWTIVHTGTSRRAHVHGLTIDTIHHFRVCAMGTAGTGPYSGVVGQKVR